MVIIIIIDIDDPIRVPSSSSDLPEPDPEQVAKLAEMGFTSAQARKALRETVLSNFYFYFVNDDFTNYFVCNI